MQKKLEAELISIAHRILKLKNKSELDQLYTETGKLYEKLAVLKFVETHFAEAKPTIGYTEVSKKMETAFDSAEIVEEETPVATEVSEETEEAKPEASEEKPKETPEEPIEETPEVEEPETEEESEKESDEIEEPKASEENEESEPAEIEGGVDTEIPEEEQVHSVEEEAEAADVEHEVQETEEVASDEKEDEFKPSFELSFERKEEDNTKSPKQISFEDLLGGHDYSDEMFEKVGEKKSEAKVVEPEEIASEEKSTQDLLDETAVQPEPEVEKPYQRQTMHIDKSEYEKPAPSSIGKTISFGLNDRIGFEKNLFGGSAEDMNRVVSQLNTFNSFQEAQDFIENMVKPDYNNWENKDDYAKRFMDIVEKKFS